jgi:UDP-glucose 4-epimerase/UDP-glucuronate decarboxylase
MSKIIITGGAGFIGYHLANTLSLKKENYIVIADNFFRGKKDLELEDLLAKPNVEMVEADLTDPSAWNKIGTGYDYVYHLISVNGFMNFKKIPHEVLRVGLTTTLNAIDWFYKKNSTPEAKILYTSSNEVYSGATRPFGQPQIPTPEKIPEVIPDTYDPRWSYAGQKIMGELFFIHFSKAFNFRMVIVRPHNIYGPRGGFDAMIPKMIDRIKKRMEPFPLISPEENRSSCYISDVTEAMIATIESKKTDGGTYNIGGEKETNVGDLLEQMFAIMNWRPTKFDVKESPGDSSVHCLPDISKLRNDANWRPKVSLEEGLRKTIEWYLQI